METRNEMYVDAAELKEILNISKSKAYELIRGMNAELKKEGYIVIPGRVPRRYLEKRYYGYIAG